MTYQLGGRVFPLVMGRLAIHLFLSPGPGHGVSQQMLEHAKLAQQQDVNTPSGVIRGYTWLPADGTYKATVLLVHGWSGQALSMWPFINPLLEKDFRVIAMDAPAHGSSHGKTTNILKVSTALREFLRNEPELQGIIAHSFGGPVTAFTLRQYMRDNTLPTRNVVTLGAPDTFSYMVQEFSEMLSIPPGPINYLINHLETLLGEKLAAMGTGSFFRTVEGLNLLVIHDRGDDRVPAEQAGLMAEHIHDAKLMLTEGLGHRRILRDEKVITAAIDHISSS